MSYRFGSVEVRPQERALLIAGRRAHVGARAFDLLIALIERRERVVTKDELLDLVWPGLVVEENNLQAQVSTLRKLLGRETLATVSGRGYRFAASLDDGAGPGSGLASNVPLPRDRLVGRARELAQLRELLNIQRFVCVVGPGGVGKTRLAQEAAIGPQGLPVWWVDLAAQVSASQVAAAIAGAGSLDLGDGDAVRLLARELARKVALIVMDNCEQLDRDGAGVVGAILEASAGVRILATSRAPLHVRGEHVYRLDPLGVPTPGTPLALARLEDAIVLLEERACAVDSAFHLTESSIGDAIEIVLALDGMPLAIEMAAVRAPALGLRAVRERIAQGLDGLPATMDSPPRQRTLRATLEWSYSLLGPGDQKVLRRLCVFPASFRLETARAIAMDEHLEAHAAVESLMELVSQSLVQVEPSNPPRYRLLETTRMFAAEQLDLAGERAWTLARHDLVASSLAEEIAQARWALPAADWLARHLPDYRDLEQAFERAARERDAETAAATGEALAMLDIERDLIVNARRLKDAAQAMLSCAGPLARARLYNCLSMFRLITPHGMTRLEVGQERVESWRRHDDAQQLCLALAALALDQAAAGDGAGAERSVREARSIEKAEWPLRLRCRYRIHVAMVGLYRGDVAGVIEATDTILRQAAAPGDGRIAAVALHQRARAALLSPVAGDAVALFSKAASAFGAVEWRRLQAGACAGLCAAQLGRGDVGAALDAAREALSFDAMLYGVFITDHLALLAATTGHTADGARMLGYADSIFERTQDRRMAPEADSEARAVSIIERVLGSEEHQRLRAVGRFLDADAFGTVAARVVGNDG